MRISFYKIIFNDGEVVFDLSKVSRLSGLGNSKFDIGLTKLATGSGSLKTSATLSPRQIDISTKIDRDKSDFLQQYFDGRNTIKLRFGDRYIFAECELSDLSYPDGAYNAPQLDLQFICPDPRFYSVDTFSKNLAGVVSLFGFPFESTIADGVDFGYRQFQNETFYTNNGKEPVGFKMRFIAIRGPSSNIKLINPTTKEYLQAIVNLAKGDELLMSTLDGQKDVFLNGVSVFDKVTKESEYWQLAPGDNLIIFDAENESNLDAWLDFQPRYTNALLFPEVKKNDNSL